MIEIEKDFPFEECENCKCFDPDLRITKIYGDFTLINHTLQIVCGKCDVCREIRDQINREAENNGADK